MIRWLSFSSDQPSFTAGHVRTGATSASTGPVAVAASSGADFPEAKPDRPTDAVAASKPCGHRANVWCSCVKYRELPEDDPDVIHEHVIEETY